MIATRIFRFSAHDDDVRAISKASFAPIILSSRHTLDAKWCRNMVSGRMELCWRATSARDVSANATEPPSRCHCKEQTCNALKRDRPKPPNRRTMRGAYA